jgi:hypothetical protein
MAKMLLAEHHDMIEAVPADRANDPLRISILPWRPHRNRSIPYAHCGKAPDEGFAISAIPIPNEYRGASLLTTGFGQLPRNPFGIRVGGHTQPQKLSAAMPQDPKSVEQPK